MDVSHLPYRPCVGLMILNRENKIFAGQRIDNRAEAWQMPQGGVDEGETPRQAALRELEEEVGLVCGEIEIVAESADWIPYDLPAHLVPTLWGGRFRGQIQKWFLVRLITDDSAINIETEEPEFRAWQWLDAETLMEKIVPFKRATYRQVFAAFETYLQVE